MIFSDASHKEYDEWDIRLVKAYHFLENMLEGDFPVWITQSSRIRWDVDTRVSEPKRMISLAEERANKAGNTHGVYFTVQPVLADDGAWPTLDDWMIEERERNGEKGLE
jgi:hypothetical protein